ncbi:hypothetical protein MBANPS3_010721 [Mucor bainieri]
MKADLLSEHPMRTSYSVESFHNVLYGTKPRTKTSKRLIKYYSQSDSRAPDNSEALFGDANSQVLTRENACKKTPMQITLTALSRKARRRELPLYKSEEKDVTTEGMDEDVFDEVKLLLADDGAFDCDVDYGDFMDDEDGKEEDSKKGDDAISVASSANDDFSFDLSTDDITILDNVAASSVDINELFFNGPGPVYCKLSLNANADDSCYLDAPLEIIARCVFPYVKKSFEVKCRMNYIVDAALLTSLKEYDQGNQMFREFVWKANDLFKKGDQNDVNLSFTWIQDNMSSQLRSLISFGQSPKFSHCRQSPSHTSFKKAQLQWFPCVSQYPSIMKNIIAVKSIVDRNKQAEAITCLNNDFSTSFAQH